MNEPWLIRQDPNPYADCRLFCFPFAGGSAGTYHRWPRLAPSHLDVCAVEYPGRGIRCGEEPFLRLGPLVRHLADLLEPLLTEPFAFFGHSMGGLVAFELAKTLRERGTRQPCHLFISSTAAPGLPLNRRPLTNASDAEVLEELCDLGGTPRELLDDRELMAMAVRVLRADYTVLGTYEYRPAAPLGIPMTVFGGRSDEIAPLADLRGWRAHTAVDCRFAFFPGDHFYLHDAAGDILTTVAGQVSAAPSVPALAR
jgi:medium-chain acyl-[acyl-carrier-protein] hydrolase